MLWLPETALPYYSLPTQYLNDLPHFPTSPSVYKLAWYSLIFENQLARKPESFLGPHITPVTTISLYSPSWSCFSRACYACYLYITTSRSFAIRWSLLLPLPLPQSHRYSPRSWTQSWENVTVPVLWWLWGLWLCFVSHSRVHAARQPLSGTEHPPGRRKNASANWAKALMPSVDSLSFTLAQWSHMHSQTQHQWSVTTPSQEWGWGEVGLC